MGCRAEARKGARPRARAKWRRIVMPGELTECQMNMLIDLTRQTESILTGGKVKSLARKDFPLRPVVKN